MAITRYGDIACPAERKACEWMMSSILSSAAASRQRRPVKAFASWMPAARSQLSPPNHIFPITAPLSKAYLRGERPLSKVFVHPEAFYRDHKITVYTDAEATKITRRSRRVTLANGESIGYEEMLLATGGRAWRLPLAGVDLPGVFTLRTLDDSDAIRKAARSAKQVLVIGGSFIGCEVAASLSQMGVQVAMCFLEDYPLQAVVPEDLGRHVQALLEGRGVTVIPRTRPERIEGTERAEQVQLENDQVIEADLVIMGVGIVSTRRSPGTRNWTSPISAAWSSMSIFAPAIPISTPRETSPRGQI